MSIDYSKLKAALQHLEAQLGNYRASETREELTELDREAIAESTIQRFETAYDTCWKTLKRYLVEELGLADVQNSPKPILRLAADNQLLANDIDEWMKYADARTDTAHDYSKEKAQKTLTIIPGFLDDAIGLFQTMSGESWE